MKDDTVVLTTGGRSEEYAMKTIKLADHCFVQIGDFSGYAIRECAKNGIKIAYVMGFIGKLAKMAAGVKQTHVKGSKVDMKLLAEIAIFASLPINPITYAIFIPFFAHSRIAYPEKSPI